MVKINVKGFAEKVADYHADKDRPDKWFNFTGSRLEDDSVESTLSTLSQEDGVAGSYRRGIKFGHNTRLAVILLERAYQKLSPRRKLIDSRSIRKYTEAVAEAIQNFSRPFPDDDLTLCYPHFLLHGIVQPTIRDIVEKIESNARIIHETLDSRDQAITAYGRRNVSENLMHFLRFGNMTDYFGLQQWLVSNNDKARISETGYVAQTGFFLDRTNKEIYVLFLQGGRFPKGESSDEAKKEYDRIGSALGMSPRRFVLEQLMTFGREQRFNKIKVVVPEEYPLAIENHEGFNGNYEPVIIKAGITERNGFYLEKSL